MLESQWHGPGIAGLRFIGRRQFRRTLPRRARDEGVVWRPPDLDRQAVGTVAKRGHRLREFARLGNRHDLRVKALLGSLRPECRQIRRYDHAGDYVDTGALEGRNLCGEIVGHRLEAPCIDQLITKLVEHRRKAQFRIAPGIAVGIIRPQRADNLVGVEMAPQPGEGGNHVLKAPEEMVGPLEANRRIALATEEMRLPGRVVGDAGHTIEFGLAGNRIGGVRRRGGGDDVDLVGQDQLLCHGRRAVGVGLTVLDDEFNRVLRPIDHDPIADSRLELFENEAIRFGEDRQWTGLRCDKTDPDGLRFGDGRHRKAADGSQGPCRTRSPQDGAARH